MKVNFFQVGALQTKKGVKTGQFTKKKISFEKRRYLGEEIKLLPLYFKVESG
ncbi:hypothetical protein SPAR2_1948 [Streptococcus pneumoniae GA02270]|nr:hypothetical protein SPAR2_1948 [Streptococcus pneumoniae GA02270]